MCLSIIIPVYNCNDHLDICLLSILGQVKISDVEVVCVPIGHPAEIERLMAWNERDKRVIAAQESQSLMEAFLHGINSAKGDYVLFMNQTDTIASAESLSKAAEQAREKEIQVLLAPSLQRKGVNAFSETYINGIDKALLPQDLGEVFPITKARSGILLAGQPVPYGNIYKRNYLASLFSSSPSFGNTGDLMIAMISLLHAENISICVIPVIERRHEGFCHPLLSSEELQNAEKRIAIQVMLMLADNAGSIIAHNVIVSYLSWLILSCHPYSEFCKVKEHYRDIILKLTDMTRNDVIPRLFHYWYYLQSLVSIAGDELIEVYSLSNPIQSNEQE